MKKGLIYSAIILTVGSLFAKFVGVFLKLPLINIVGDYGIGLYQLPYPIYTTVLTFTMTGFSLAVSKQISSSHAEKDYRACKLTFYTGLIVITAISFMFSLAYVLLSKKIIEIFKWPQEAYTPYLSLAPALFLVSVQASYRGYFNGVKKMYITSISQIIESIGRVCFGLLFCILLLKKGVHFSVAGALAGSSIGALFSLIYLIFVLQKDEIINSTKNNAENKEVYRDIILESKNILLLTIYFSLSSLLMSVISIVDSLLFPYFIHMRGYQDRIISQLFGIFSGKAMTLIHVPLTFSVSMAVSIVSYVVAAKQQKEKRELICTAFEYIILVTLPCCAAFYFFSDTIFKIVFFNATTGDSVLKISAFLTILISLVQFTTSVLQATGHFMAPVKSILTGVIIKIICMFVFIVIYNLNISGLVLANIMCYFVVFMINLDKLKSFGFAHFNMLKMFYIVLSSAIMVIVGRIILNILKTSVLIEGVVMITCCACVYFMCAFMFGILKVSTIKEFIFEVKRK